jgi:hypothetical protein
LSQWKKITKICKTEIFHTYTKDDLKYKQLDWPKFEKLSFPNKKYKKKQFNDLFVPN